MKKDLQYFQQGCEGALFISKNTHFRPKLPPPYPSVFSDLVNICITLKINPTRRNKRSNILTQMFQDTLIGKVIQQEMWSFRDFYSQKKAVENGKLWKSDLSLNWEL